MQREDQDHESEPFVELFATADVSEQIAQAIVGQIRTLIQHRVRFEPVDTSAFPDRDWHHYDTLERELSELGFEVLGDFADAAQVATESSKKTPVRVALGAHGSIAALWFEVLTAEGESLRCLTLYSWMQHGRTLVTTRGTKDSGLPVPPEIVVEKLPEDTGTKAAVLAHGERVAASGQAPRRMRGLDEIFASCSQDELTTAQFREAQGVALYEPLLRASLGANYEEQGEPILDAIQRHPEWLRGESFTEGPAPRVDAVRVGAVRAGDVDMERFPHLVVARIPEHIGPIDRGERYEDLLQEALAIRELGLVTGGGSQLTRTTEIEFVDVELALADLDESLETAKRVLEEAGAPVGSHFLFERNGVDVELPFGTQEALILYLDGVSLPDEVYQTLDLDDFMERLGDAVDSAGGEPRTTWTGPAETAFYHYGPSAAGMLEAMQPLLDAHPICQNARIVIREGTDGATRTIRVPRRAA